MLDLKISNVNLGLFKLTNSLVMTIGLRVAHLIGAIEDADERENMFFHYVEMKKKRAFNANDFLDDLLRCKYTFKI